MKETFLSIAILLFSANILSAQTDRVWTEKYNGEEYTIREVKDWYVITNKKYSLAQGNTTVDYSSDGESIYDYRTRRWDLERKADKIAEKVFHTDTLEPIHDSFTYIQKAINYSMTSFFTTGGIRGGKKKMDKFYPRSFNMGVRRTAYARLGGFSNMRFGEDIDFSIRIFKEGYHCRLFPDAWVYHKRRTDLKKFFKQVHNSGIARINLYKKYPESLKLVHWLPAVFTLGVTLLMTLFAIGLIGLVLSFCALSMTSEHCVTTQYLAIIASILVMLLSLAPIFLYSLIVFADSASKNKSLKIGFYSILASFIQLIGYGTGFWRAWWKRCILGKDEFEAFKKNFYK